MNTPKDILNYIVNSKREFDFLTALTSYRNNFSIAEITDKNLYIDNEGKCRFEAPSYKISMEINDDEIVTATFNKLYVSAFISRYEDKYNVHFLVHQYPESMKAKFEEEITKEVIQYMILNTIVTLKLDTFKKVDNYING